MLRAGTRKLLKSGFYPLVRLVIVLSVLLAGSVLLLQYRQASLKPDAETASAIASHRVASRQPAITAAAPSNAKIGNVPPAVLTPAAAPQPSPQEVEPSRLREIYERGEAAMERAASPDEQAAAARQVYVAAALGYSPARAFIAREYPRSAAVRAAVPAPDAVRFSLDPIASSADAGAGPFTVLVTAYFAGRGELAGYAEDLLDALSDDRRLQSDAAIDGLLHELSRVAGACIAVSRAVVHVRIIAGSGCSALLKPQLKYYLGHHAPSGVAAESRSRALKMLSSQADIGSSAAPKQNR